MAEAVALLVLAGRVVGMGEAGHEDDAEFLAETLHGDRHARRRAARDHDGAVALDHALGAVARRVRLGLRVAVHVGDFLAEHAVALERGRLHRLDHAAVALAVEVLDGKLEGLELVGAFVRIGAGQRHVPAEGHGVAGRHVAGHVLGIGAADEMHRRGKAHAHHCAGLEKEIAG